MQTRSRSHLRFALCILIALASLCTWRDLHRFWYPAADDYKFVAITNRPGISFTVQEWATVVWNDWSWRVGRLGDGVFRLIVRPGFDTWKWFAPLCYTLLGIGIHRWLGSRHRELRLVAGLLVLPTALAVWPNITGDGVFWADAAVNYLVPTTLVVFVAHPALVLLRRDAEPSWRWLAFAIPAGLLAQLMHEQASWTLLGIGLVVVAAKRGRLGARSWAMVGAWLFGFVAQMSAPGLWARLGRMTTGPTGPHARVHNVALAGGTLHASSAELWVVLAVVAALGSFLLPARKRLVPALWTVGIVGLVIAGDLWVRRAPERDAAALPVAQNMLVWQSLLALCLFGTLFVGLVALWKLVDVWGYTPLLAWMAFCASWAPTVLTGVRQSRAYLVPVLWLLVVIIAALFGLAARARRSWVLPAIVVAMLVTSSFLWWNWARPALATNHRFVTTRVLPQFELAAAGELNRVVLPWPMPVNDAGYNNSFSVPRYELAFERYYGIPKDVKFVTTDSRRIKPPRAR